MVQCNQEEFMHLESVVKILVGVDRAVYLMEGESMITLYSE